MHTRMIVAGLAAVLFLMFVRSGKKLTKKEAMLLLSVYIIFILVEVFIPK